MGRFFRRKDMPKTDPDRVGPGSVTGRKASGIILTSQVDEWVPIDAGPAPEHEAPSETTPSDWLPADLPEPTSTPPPPERKRSTVNQVPPEVLAAARPPARPVAQAAGGPVNLNTASHEELMTLPGMTRRAAEQVVEHRPFEALDDLTSVPGFHAERVARLAGAATV